MKRVSLHYSEALIRKAVKAFWFRVTGWRFFVAIAFVLFSLIYSLWSGDRSWRVGVMASFVIIGALFALTVYFVHFRASITKFRRMRTPEATFEMGDERFRLTSDLGSSELLWTAVSEIWQFPEFWLVFFSRAQFVTIPLADLDIEARNFVLDRAKLHGAKIS